MLKQTFLIKLHRKVQEMNDEIADKTIKLDNFENQLRITIPYGYSTPLLSVPKIDPFKIKLIHGVLGHSAVQIQNRCDQSVSFDRDLNAYYEGFGNVDGDFWLGVEKIHRITTHKKHSLLIYITDYQKKIYTVNYNNFVVAGKNENYMLKSLGKYEGDAGDMMRATENRPFRVCSTRKTGWWDMEDSVPLWLVTNNLNRLKL